MLLFAPLARAAVTRRAGESLRSAVERTLAGLDVDDAAAAFAAIARANPGGLGDAPEHDVRAPARVSLREAMAAAADRDSIASEYATGYAIVFEHRPAAAAPMRCASGLSTLDAIVSAARRPAGVSPRHADRAQGGRRAARAVSAAAREVRDGTRSLADFDASLRSAGNRLNPGTTADLVAATLLAALLTGVRLP